jgi:hypothetical protein
MQQTYIIDHPKPYPSFPLLSPRTAPPPIPVCGLRRCLASPLCPTAPPPQERPGRARTPPPWRVRGGARGGRGHIRPAAPPPTARRPLPRRRDGPVKSRGGHSGGGIWSGQRRMVDDGEEQTRPLWRPNGETGCGCPSPSSPAPSCESLSNPPSPPSIIG